MKDLRKYGKYIQRRLSIGRTIKIRQKIGTDLFNFNIKYNTIIW